MGFANEYFAEDYFAGDPNSNGLGAAPATIWKPSSGNGEYGLGTNDDIIDPSNNFLVDPSGNQVVSTDSTFTQVPRTEWTEDNSV